MEEATRNHFFNHGKSVSNACHWCQIRSFATHSTLPITIVNKRGDGATIPPGFRFVDASILCDGVEAAAPSFRSGCSCEDNDDCMYGGCECLQEIDSSDDEGAEAGGSGDGGGRRRRKKFAYHSHSDKAGLMRSKILESKLPIYECHAECGCGIDCPNRVVERGRQVPLQIFRTESRGWGVQTMAEIRRGQFVDKYLGEIITFSEAQRRRENASIAQRKDVYLFALDKFSDWNSLDPRLAGPPLEVDGEFISGPTRFINHSCEPNLRIFARVGDHADKHIHDLALFAIEDIPKGDELTFDYVNGLDDMDSDARDPAKQGDMTKCLCGSAKCRGFLW